MFLQQQGSQVLFKRSSELPTEPAWVAVCHDEQTLDIWTLSGLLRTVSYGGGVGQWRMLPAEGHWVLESDDAHLYDDESNDRLKALEARIERLEILPLTSASSDDLEERVTALENARARAVDSVDTQAATTAESPASPAPVTTPAPVTNNGLE